MEDNHLKTTLFWSIVAKGNKEIGQLLARKIRVKVFMMRKKINV